MPARASTAPMPGPIVPVPITAARLTSPTCPPLSAPGSSARRAPASAAARTSARRRPRARSRSPPARPRTRPRRLPYAHEPRVRIDLDLGGAHADLPEDGPLGIGAGARRRDLALADQLAAGEAEMLPQQRRDLLRLERGRAGDPLELRPDIRGG